MVRRTLTLLLLLGATVPTSFGDEPWKKSIPTAIDHFVNKRLAEAKVKPAPRADEAVLLRRIMFDLVGRPPTMVEAQQFLAKRETNKWEILVDRLIASEGFIRHQATELNTQLMAGAGDLKGYLNSALREKLSWDQIFSELILAETKDKKRSGAEQFIKSRISDLDKLTNAASVAFFGINVSCAKCHDHPLVDAWKQDHFYGMKSFFSRTFDNGGFLGEREYGLVSFKTTEGESKTAKLMFLTGTELKEPASKEPKGDAQKKEKKLLDELKKKKQPPPKPKFSRRAQLIDVALRPKERQFLAKSIVNRLWGRFYGRGLVMPLDQMHPENPPSHPELLDWLAKDFVDHKYDIRRLIRGLVLSEVYSRSSRWPQPDQPQPDAELFAVASLRALTPLQYATALKLSSANPDQFEKVKDDREKLLKQIERFEKSAGGLTSWFEQPHEDFQISVTEALRMSNAEQAQRDLLRDDNSSLVGKLKSLKDDRAAASLAIWTIHGRAPQSEELELLADYLKQGKKNRVDALRQMVWAMLSGSESRFNY